MMDKIFSPLFINNLLWDFTSLLLFFEMNLSYLVSGKQAKDLKEEKGRNCLGYEGKLSWL